MQLIEQHLNTLNVVYHDPQYSHPDGWRKYTAFLREDEPLDMGIGRIPRPGILGRVLRLIPGQGYHTVYRRVFYLRSDYETPDGEIRAYYGDGDQPVDFWPDSRLHRYHGRLPRSIHLPPPPPPPPLPPPQVVPTHLQLDAKRNTLVYLRQLQVELEEQDITGVLPHSVSTIISYLEEQGGAEISVRVNEDEARAIAAVDETIKALERAFNDFKHIHTGTTQQMADALAKATGRCPNCQRTAEDRGECSYCG